ncbi:MAG: thiamine pyrophosphate-dependent enzyme [Gaiella sp.]|nr:thiamine pyrophosphate-dependent enzyme [Gaiella sp.]
MAGDLDPLEQHLVAALRTLEAPATTTDLPGEAAAAWRSQIASRAIDHAARWLQAQKLGFYTIGSAGHESNALVALGLRPTDPALLHYRSGGFYLARAEQAGHDGVDDVLLGMAAAVEEPIAGGRHKVFGHRELAVIPQTSTIASHLPRAVGIAFAIERARLLGVACAWPLDAVVICSFGDASLNHATAQAALNAAAHFAYRGEPLPLLFVCEDNGIGISVPTPEGWVEQSLHGRPELAVERADGDDPAAVLATATELAAWVREHRQPAVLHLRTVRYLSHAGADLETAYRTGPEIRADFERDPVLATGRWLVAGGRSGDELADEYLDARAAIRERALEATTHRQMETPEEVMCPLAPRNPAVVAELAGAPGREAGERLTLAQAIDAALGDVLERHPETLHFGEDVGVKGGVYGVTRGLQSRFGAARVFDTLLDETTILGLALGTAVSGFVPIPEIQYLAYLHNAEDQLRGEAATLRFFSQGAYRNGMVVRIQGYGYQKGFGGHFHNDNGLGVLRDIPGIVIASPARPNDAAAMLRTCVAAAKADGAVCVFLEPIALYHTRDLHEEGDELWLGAPGAEHVPVGAAYTHRGGDDLTVVTWANGLYLSLRVARRLEERGIGVTVVDLRWLAPLPLGEVLREASATGRTLVVDETRRTGGVGEGIVAELLDAGYDGRLARVASKDSFVPLGDAARLVLLSEDEIEAAALALLDR